MTSFRSVAFFFGALVVGCGSNAELVAGDSGDPVVSTGGSSGAGGAQHLDRYWRHQPRRLRGARSLRRLRRRSMPRSGPPARRWFAATGRSTRWTRSATTATPSRVTAAPRTASRSKPTSRVPRRAQNACRPSSVATRKISPGTETCDDGNTNPKDGCDATCKIEPGWDCEVAGELCVPHCGDGMIVGDEECEFYNGATPTAGSGCGIDCRIEPGWDCNATPRRAPRRCAATRWSSAARDATTETTFPSTAVSTAWPSRAATAAPARRYAETANVTTPKIATTATFATATAARTIAKSRWATSARTSSRPRPTRSACPVIYRDFMGDIKNDEQTTRAMRLSRRRVRPLASCSIPTSTLHGNGTSGRSRAKLGTDGRPVYVVPNNPAARQLHRQDQLRQVVPRRRPFTTGRSSAAIDSHAQRPSALRLRQQHHRRLLSPRQQGVRSHPRRSCELLQSQLQFHHRDTILVRVRR